VINIDQ